MSFDGADRKKTLREVQGLASDVPTEQFPSELAVEVVPTQAEVVAPRESARESLGPSNPSTDLPPVLTVDELAALLRLDRKSIYEALARGQIPGARRIGRRYRIGRDAVLDWLRGQDRVSRARRIP
jgi:excisionase family DNA binding protein